MEHQDFERITVLKVGKICCEAYQKKLQKKLLKHEGVSSVEITPGEGLVVVIGKVDPNFLVSIVARTGKHAVIVCSDKKLSHTKCCNNCCQEKEKKQPKCEDYAPPPSFDERMFRDYWCRHPAGEFSGHFGNSGPFRRDPRWFAAAPPPLPNGFSFRRPGFYGYGYFH